MIRYKDLYAHQTEAIDLTSKCSRGVINHPTGTGKTTIISWSIIKDIEHHVDPKSAPVYVVLDPKIVLADQVFADVRGALLNKGQDCHYHIVHSGGMDEDDIDEIRKLKKLAKANNIKLRATEATTSFVDIQDEYNKSLRSGCPLVIFSTYKSAHRLVEANIPIRIVLCDEAHHLVSSSGERAENNWITVDFPTDKMFFFTATMKVTQSNDSVGMNNTDRFGPLLSQKSPKDMIEAGVVIRPRMHVVERASGEGTDEELWAEAIVESFFHHKRLLRQNSSTLGAKLIIRTRGSDDVPGITKRLLEDAKLRDVRIFDITSKYNEHVDGERVSRKQFLRALKTLKEGEDAIILQIEILSEGIDISGITGILPMKSIGVTEFSQLLGRAMRLHPTDRAGLKLKQLSTDIDGLESYQKPYAWIVIPKFDLFTEEMADRFRDFVISARDYGVNPVEDVEVTDTRAAPPEEGLSPEDLGEEDEEDPINPPTEVMDKHVFFTFEHMVESIVEIQEQDVFAAKRREANRLSQENERNLRNRLIMMTRPEKNEFAARELF